MSVIQLNPEAFSSQSFKPVMPLTKYLQGIVWDIDGTAVINNEENALWHIGSVLNRYTEKKYGVTIKGLHFPDHAGKPLADIRALTEKHLREEQGVIIKLPDFLDDRIKEERTQQPMQDEEVLVHPFFKSILSVFYKNGVAMAAATGGELPRAYRYLKQAGLDLYIPQDRIFYGHKPCPDCYNNAMDCIAGVTGRLAVSPKRIVSFEDSLSGVVAGHNAGVHVIGHLLAHHIPEKRKDELEKEMRLAGASAVIRDNDTCLPALYGVMKEIAEHARKEEAVLSDRSIRNNKLACCSFAPACGLK